MNKTLKHFKTVEDAEGSIVMKPSIVNVKDDTERIGYFLYVKDPDSIQKEETITLLKKNDSELMEGFLKIELECTQNTTLDIFYTKKDYENQIPNEVLDLITGENVFYFNRNIYRIGFVKYNINNKRPYYSNPYITKIKLSGIIEDGWRLFDNYVIPHNIVDLDLSDLNLLKMTNMSGLIQSSYNLTRIGDLSKWDTSNILEARFSFNGFDYPMELTSVGDISGWNLKKCTTIEGLFNECGKIDYFGDLGNWDTSSITNVRLLFRNCYSLKTPGNISYWNTSNFQNTKQLFQGCKNLKSMNLSEWNVSNVTDVSTMFSNCNSLTMIGNLSGWDVSNVTSMRSMFWNCFELTSLGDLSGWSAPLCTDAGYMFGGYEGTMKLTSLDLTILFKNGVVKDLSAMFQNCSNLTQVGDLSEWNVSNVTNVSTMFSNCNSLTMVGNLSGWNVSNVTSMRSMFYHCNSLTSVGDLSEWKLNSMDSINLNLDYMFCNCFLLNNIGDISDWKVNRVTDMSFLFTNSNCFSGVDFSNWDTSNVTSMRAMFGFDSNAINITADNIGLPPIPKNCNTQDMFHYFLSLKNIINCGKISSSVSFDRSPLTKKSVMLIIQNLDQDNPGTLTLSDYSYGLLDSDYLEELETTWQIVSSTLLESSKNIPIV